MTECVGKPCPTLEPLSEEWLRLPLCRGAEIRDASGVPVKRLSLTEAGEHFKIS